MRAARRWSIGLSIVLLALLVAPSSQAQEPTRGLTVLPPNVSIEANRGDQIERTIGLENTTNVTQDIRVEVRNFAPTGEVGGAAPTDEDSSYSMARWIEVDTTEFSIEPGERENIAATIRVPDNAEPGSHFGSVVFVPSSPADDTGSFSVTTEVASLILLRVPGDARQEASVEQFAAQRNDSGEVDFLTRLNNQGTVHFVPQGQVTITDTFGREAKVLPMNIDSRPVLPGSIRRFDNSWDAGFMLGRYKAELKLTYPDNIADRPNRELSATTTLWVVPLPFVIAVIAVIALIGLLIAVKVRKRRKRPVGRRFADDKPSAE